MFIEDPNREFKLEEFPPIRNQFSLNDIKKCVLDMDSVINHLIILKITKYLANLNLNLLDSKKTKSKTIRTRLFSIESSENQFCFEQRMRSTIRLQRLRTKRQQPIGRRVYVVGKYSCCTSNL